MKDYIVIIKNTPTEISAEVKIKMESGWKPLGGISLALGTIPSGTRTASITIYAQALVKE